MNKTYTFADLEVSSDAFNEIADKLRLAGYDHVFSDYYRIIDMQGIGLISNREPSEAEKLRIAMDEAIELIESGLAHQSLETLKVARGLLKKEPG